MTVLERGIAWVQESLAKLRQREEAVAEKYRRRHDDLAQTDKPKPRPPKPPAVVTARARRRIALICGVNDYGGRSDLRGCVTDARRWGYLYRLGGWEVVTLLDRETAGDSITAVLGEMARSLEPGDELGWVCSSHGTRLPDREDPTGEVAAVVPADAIDNSSTDWFVARCITHREIAAIVRELPEDVRFHALIDACHSGIPPTSLLSARALGDPTAPPEWRPRFLEPPTRSRSAAHLLGFAAGVRELVPVAGIRSLILSGCRPEQTSADAWIDGVYCGAFSHHVMAAANRIRGGEVSAILESAARTLKRDGFDQIPQAQGDPSRLAEPVPWLPK